MLSFIPYQSEEVEPDSYTNDFVWEIIFHFKSNFEIFFT